MNLDALQKHVRALINERELHLYCPSRLNELREDPAQRIDQLEKLRPENMALAHVDDPVRFLGIEAHRRALADFQCAQSRPSTAVGRRQMRITDLGGKPVLRERALHSRDEIAAISLVIGMLELAPAAFREM